MKKTILLLLAFLAVSACHKPAVQYNNPVINENAPDPTVIRGDDGAFYLFATQRQGNIPIYRSENLVDWEFTGWAFDRNDRPHLVEGAGYWAPDVQKVGDRYILYFSNGVWDGLWESGIACAESESLTGPYHYAHILIPSPESGVKNSIDQNFFSEGGKNYMAWGSFYGIYLIELSKDGRTVGQPFDRKIQIAGTAYEGSYIHKHDGKYYLFASIGTCCEGLRSRYTLVVGRSDSLEGPYTDRHGNPMLSNFHEILVSGDNYVRGPGHCSEIITDDAGQDWIIYHGYDADDPDAGRKAWLDRVDWEDGWPVMAGSVPRSGDAPYFKK